MFIEALLLDAQYQGKFRGVAGNINTNFYIAFMEGTKFRSSAPKVTLKSKTKKDVQDKLN